MDYKIYNEDCLISMKELADNSVDMVLTDLPYGITNLEQDIRIPLEPFWAEINRVTKETAAIVLFCQMNSCPKGTLPFALELIAKATIPFRYEWCWEKSLGVGFLNAKKMPLRCHENILVFYNKLPTYNPQYTAGKPKHKCKHKNTRTLNYHKCGNLRNDVYENDGTKYYPRDVIYFSSTVGREERFHPQQKPIGLLEYLIKSYTNEGETVLDATMGSGSTGVAAINTGRRFIGFDTDAGFYEMAGKRISEAVAKKEQSLFNLDA